MTVDPIEHLLSFPVTRPFGDLSFPLYGPHTGVDLAMPEGTPLYAIGAGVVTVDDDDPAFDAGAPATWSGIQVTYRLAADGATVTCAHLRVNTAVHGAPVGEGQKIGESGTTGASTGPHLHLEVRDIDGSLVDPIPYLEGLMFTDADRAMLMKAAADAAEAKKWATEAYQKSAALGDSTLTWLRRLFFGRNPDTGIARGKELDPGT